MMRAKDVAKLYKLFEEAGIKVWIDGGWATDALLGEETRLHNDLDIAIEQKDTVMMQEILLSDGYKVVPRDDSSKWSYVMSKDELEIDVHVFVSDETGSVIGGIMYPTESLNGTGTILGQKVRCISAPHMIKFMEEWVHKHPDKYKPAISALRKKFAVNHFL